MRNITMMMFIMVSCCLSSAYANNLAIKNVNISAGADADHATIQFDISWDNSWRFSANIHDAAWVFVKYAIVSGGAAPEWLHADISSVDMSAISGTSLDSSLPTDDKGVFIFRSSSAQGKGTLSTSGVKLQWPITFSTVDPATVDIRLKVFALEMVRIPQGAFYVGDGTATTVQGQFCTYNSTTTPFRITSEGALTLGGGGAGSLANNNTSGMSAVDDFNNATPQTLPAAFPKGYAAFYIMKYELTQGQYRDFLNTLTRDQQNQRAGNGTTLASGTTSVTNRYVLPNTDIAANIASAFNYRNGIRCDAVIPLTDPITFYCDYNHNGIPNESTDGEFIACNYLKWSDLIAYADWAGLRPFTELEYEKAARGTAYPVANEYAWGTVGNTTVSGITNSGANNELATNSGNYVCASGIQGPLRSGFAATSSSSRSTAGASFYGVMELSGNLMKRPVSVGHPTGRGFTGAHGNGALDVNGDTDVGSTWPGTDAAGSGIRGGSWSSGDIYARASDRYYAVGTGENRNNDYGARFARTAID